MPPTSRRRPGAKSVIRSTAFKPECCSTIASCALCVKKSDQVKPIGKVSRTGKIGVLSSKYCSPILTQPRLAAVTRRRENHRCTSVGILIRWKQLSTSACATRRCISGGSSSLAKPSQEQSRTDGGRLHR